MPVVPATLLGRLRQENGLNPGGGGCGEPRSRHCTPAWVTRAKLRLKNIYIFIREGGSRPGSSARGPGPPRSGDHHPAGAHPASSWPPPSHFQGLWGTRSSFPSQRCNKKSASAAAGLALLGASEQGRSLGSRSRLSAETHPANPRRSPVLGDLGGR